MNNKDFISIVFPTFNSAAYVRRSLDNAIAVMDADCELVCVDDGSTDNTVEILREYEDRDPRVTVIVQEHGGCSAARKNGVDNCSGDYVLFMDSDDLLYPHAIPELRSRLEPDVDILVANVSEKFTDSTSRLLYSGHSRSMDKDSYVRYLLSRGVDFMLHGKLFRRSLFNVHLWVTDEVMKGIFHRCLLFQLVCATTGRILICPSVIAYFYVRRPGSLSAMLSLRSEGVAYLWNSMKLLPLPRREFVEWSLDLLNKMILQRGIPLPDDFGPSRDLLALTADMELAPHYRHILRMLRDPRYRLAELRRLVREGNLTAQAPHLTFVVVARDNYAAARKTIESIFDIGFRNIEVILVDDGSCHAQGLKLNAFAIKYPRIHLRKHPRTLGVMQARMTGIQAAKGCAVLFMNAGDTVLPQGVLAALDLVDSGKDVALMGAYVAARMSDFETTTFIPSILFADGEEPDADGIFRRLLLRHLTPHSVCFAVSRMDFVRRLTLLCTPQDYCAETLWQLSVAAAGATFAFTDAIGYSLQQSYGQDIPLAERVGSELAFGQSVLTLLRKLTRDTDENKAALAEGVTRGLGRVVRRAAAMPVLGPWRARRLVRNIIAHPGFQPFYDAASTPAPTASTLLSATR